MLLFMLMICSFCLFKSIMDPIKLELPNVQVGACLWDHHTCWRMCCNLCLIIICGLLDVWWVGCFSGSWGCCFKIFRTSRVGILPEMLCCCICCHEIGLQYGYFLATATTSCLILQLTGQEKRKACLCSTVDMGGHQGRWTTGTLGFGGPQVQET